MTKLLFFIESLSGGGAEKVLRNLVNAMDLSRFAVTVQTLYPEDAGKYLAPGIRYRYCYASAARGSVLRMRAEAALGLTYPLHIRDDYDIEIAYLECGATKIMAGSTNKNALKLAWVHCDLAKKADDPAAFARETARYYRRYDGIVCVSEDVRRSFAAMYPDSPALSVLCNTYDDAEILQKSALPLPAGAEKRRLTAAAVGRLTDQKGFDRLLRVHRQLLAEGLEYDLWILGEGPDRPALEAYIREQHMQDSVRLWGFQDNPYPFLRAADLLVCSSRYEGFSTVAVEGMLLGKPMVTTDCTGMREILGSSEYGLITDNNDEAFCQGLRRMLTEPGLLAHYAAQAKQRGGDFRREKLARQTEAFLERAYQEKRR